MHDFWYDYVWPRYDKKVKLCGMDKDSFIVYIKTDDIYKNIGEDVETRFDTLNYEINILLLTVKNKKVIRLMKDELGAKIMTKFAGLRAKTYCYLRDDSREVKKARGTKSVL